MFWSFFVGVADRSNFKTISKSKWTEFEFQKEFVLFAAIHNNYLLRITPSNLDQTKFINLTVGNEITLETWYDVALIRLIRFYWEKKLTEAKKKNVEN